MLYGTGQRSKLLLDPTGHDEVEAWRHSREPTPTGRRCCRCGASSRSSPASARSTGSTSTSAAGEVHCLLGQNGAGKSTLIKVLAGAHRPTRARSGGRASRSSSARRTTADAAGIATIYQELDLVAGLSVAENIFLGHEPPGAGSSQPGRRMRAARGAAAPARSPRDPAEPRGRPALGGGSADREHGAGAVPRRAADRDGRAVRRARRATRSTTSSACPRPDGRRRRGRLHLPPARGDPPHRRPRDRAQGRAHRRHGTSRPRTTPTAEVDPADDRPHDRVRLPDRGRRADRRAVLAVDGLGRRGEFADVSFTVRRRRGRRTGRARRIRALRDPRDGLRRPPRRPRARCASRHGTAPRVGAARRCGPGWGWRPRSARARACCSASRCTATSPCRCWAGSPGSAS